MWTSMRINDELILNLAKREAVGRYRGSVLGVFWSLLTPLLMLGIYTFVFSYVFKARWNGAASQSRTEFAIILFAGLVIFNFFAECLNRAPGLVLSNVNFVKKVIFPLEILPFVSLLSATFQVVISLLILILFQSISTATLPLTAPLIVLVIFPLAMIVLGVSWLLAATGVFIRDVGQTIGILVSALMFLSPIFFPLSSLPPRWQFLAELNPIAFPIEQARRVLIWNQPIEWMPWAGYTAISVLIAWAGYACFQRLRSGFADVL